jgi:hypothetical protein
MHRPEVALRASFDQLVATMDREQIELLQCFLMAWRMASPHPAPVFARVFSDDTTLSARKPNTSVQTRGDA